MGVQVVVLQTVVLQWGHSGATIVLQWGYRSATIGVQYGCSRATIVLQWGYDRLHFRLRHQSCVYVIGLSELLLCD